MTGIYTPGMPVLTVLTGSELVPVDTQLSNGVSPQTAAVSTSTIMAQATGGAPGANAAAATAGAATLNTQKGKITSEALTTAAGADYTLTLTDSAITAASLILCSVANGTNTTEGLAVNRVQPGAGSAVIHIRNTHASAALNGTIVIGFLAV